MRVIAVIYWILVGLWLRLFRKTTEIRAWILMGCWQWHTISDDSSFLAELKFIYGCSRDAKAPTMTQRNAAAWISVQNEFFSCKHVSANATLWTGNDIHSFARNKLAVQNVESNLIWGHRTCMHVRHHPSLTLRFFPSLLLFFIKKSIFCSRRRCKVVCLMKSTLRK